MSTRSNHHFIGYGGHIEANIYRHSDGYPSAAGRDILHFFNEIERQCGGDTRYNDAEYLAARYVVFLAGMFARCSEEPPASVAKDWAKRYEWEKANNHRTPLNFLSVGICHGGNGYEDENGDHGDIEYIYTIDCNKLDPETGRPRVTCKPLYGDDKGKEFEITHATVENPE